MLVAISSSGRSANILAAVRLAKRLGVTIITLSAMSPRNPLRSLGALNAFVPAPVYGLAETCHAAILHQWMDMVELKGRKRG
jgi:D-sedoheptulose 7-phosphate isomerase